MVTLVLTLLGSDRAGLVSSVSQVISERGGTWQRSQMAHLADTFAGIVEVGVPAAQLDAVLADIEGLGAQGLRVSVERTSAEPPPEDPGIASPCVWSAPTVPASSPRSPRCSPSRASTSRS